MTSYLAAGFFLILLFVNYRLNRSVLYPPFIFCTMWLLVLLLYLLNLAPINRLHLETFVVVSTGAVLFSLGGAFALLVPRSLTTIHLTSIRNQHGRPVPFERGSRLIKYTIIVVLGIGICFYARHTFMAAAQGSGGGFLARARDADVSSVNEGQHPARILSYILSWSIFASVLFQLEALDRPFWIMTGIAFLGCILSTGRTGFLLLISALTCVQLLQSHHVRFFSALKFARWPFLAFLILWFGLIFTNKDTSAFGTSAGALIIIFLVSYIVGPLVALDYALRHHNDYIGVSNHTFRFFLDIASFFHLIQYSPPPQFDAFVAVPFPTNVYTVYKFYITDFGLYGGLCVFIIIGFLHTLLYVKARTGSKFGTYLFALTIYPLIMVIFDDQYSSFGLYLNIMLFGLSYMFSLAIFTDFRSRNKSPVAQKEISVE